MILNFRPSDMNTFRATFNGRNIVIHKQEDNSWKIFVNGSPVKRGSHPSARKCMERCEKVAQKIITASVQEHFVGKVN